RPAGRYRSPNAAERWLAGMVLPDVRAVLAVVGHQDVPFRGRRPRPLRPDHPPPTPLGPDPVTVLCASIRPVPDPGLASARRCTPRIHQRWGSFQAARSRHLAAVSSQQTPAEKVAENILCDLFTTVLDWTTEQVRLQEHRVDLMLTRGGL